MTRANMNNGKESIHKMDDSEKDRISKMDVKMKKKTEIRKTKKIKVIQPT